MKGENLVSDDILYEIFLLLPADSLLCFRFVCKYWFNLITSIIHDPTFVQMHMNHHHHNLSHYPDLPTILCTSGTQPYPYYNLNSLTNNSNSSKIKAKEILYPFKSPTSQVEILGSCNGLLCIQVFNSEVDEINNYLQTKVVSCSKGILCFWNPSTNEFKQLPPMPAEITETVDFEESVVMYGFGYDRIIKDYKLVRLVAVGFRAYGFYIYEETEIKVYTLGTNSWKKIDKVLPYGFAVSFSARMGSYLNGAVHWVSLKDYQIYSFNIEDDDFGVIPIPAGIVHPIMSYGAKLRVLNGCLCMYPDSFGVDEELFEVWMMMDYGVEESWTKLVAATGPMWKRLHNLEPVWIFKHGEVVVGNGGNYCSSRYPFVYKPNDNKVEHIVVRAMPVKWTNPIVHIGSFVSLKSATYVDQEQIKARMKSLSVNYLRVPVVNIVAGISYIANAVGRLNNTNLSTNNAFTLSLHTAKTGEEVSVSSLPTYRTRPHGFERDLSLVS